MLLMLRQKDLGRVIKWSIEDNMDLHEDKFVVMSYRINSSTLFRELPYKAQKWKFLTLR